MKTTSNIPAIVRRNPRRAAAIIVKHGRYTVVAVWLVAIAIAAVSVAQMVQAVK
jgi:hypothetical protein